DGRPQVGHSAFTENRTSASGGAVALENASQPVFEDCQFSTNSADENGGGMASINSTPTLRHSHFIANEAVGTGADDGYGGGLYLTGHTGITKTLAYNEFRGNKAKIGGAITLAATENIRIVNSKFTENEASRFGGGIAGIDSRNVDMVNLGIFNNQAADNGGALYSDNLAAAYYNLTIAGNAAGAINGLYAINGSHLQFLNSIIRDGMDGIYREEATGVTVLYYTSNIEGSGGTDTWNESIGSAV